MSIYKHYKPVVLALLEEVKATPDDPFGFGRMEFLRKKPKILGKIYYKNYISAITHKKTKREVFKNIHFTAEISHGLRKVSQGQQKSHCWHKKLLLVSRKLLLPAQKLLITTSNFLMIHIYSLETFL